MISPELNDYVLAYRKVKAELWYARGLPNASALATYEGDLIGNLQRLKAKIDSVNFTPGDGFLGNVYSLPKKIKPAESKSKDGPKLHFSKINDKLPKQEECRGCELESRLIALPSIDFQILGVLWIMGHGATMDRKRHPSSRANIIRRHPHKTTEDGVSEDPNQILRGDINKGYPGVFRPYFNAYKCWRSDGIVKIKKALEGGQRVFAITLDLRRFYHQIDARCVGTFGSPAPALSSKVSVAFYKCLEEWQLKFGETVEGGSEKLGIPVGLIASSLVANLVLHDLDEAIAESLTPIYYGRYVDDFFLVLSLSGNYPDAESIFNEISRLSSLAPVELPRIEFDGKSKDIRFKSSKWRESIFESKAAKQKVFHLEGTSGNDFISVLEQTILENSSEWRMVPDLDQEDEKQLADSLILSNDASEEPNSLRKADLLSLRRLGVSVALRKLEAIERFGIKPQEWAGHRESFYKLLKSHVLTHQGLCEFWPNLPRVFGLVLSQQDWLWANRFLIRIAESLRLLSCMQASSDKSSERTNYEVDSFWMWLDQVLRDELIKACSKPNRHLVKFANRFDELASQNLSDFINDLSANHSTFIQMDLDRMGTRQRLRAGQSSDYQNTLTIEDTRKAANILTGILNEGIGYIPTPDDVGGLNSKLLFPTRLINELDLCLLRNEPGIDLNDIKKISANLRGYNGYTDSSDILHVTTKTNTLPEIGKPDHISIAPEFPTKAIRVAVTNYQTELASWEGRIEGKPNLSYARLKTLLQLVDEFLRGIKKLPFDEKPLYFILPELSVPREWLLVVAAYLSNARVSFIAGAEYEEGKNLKLDNTAYLFLRSKEFGFPGTILIKQKKTRPAPGEAAGLAKFGKELSTGEPHEIPVYRHGDFHFGILLCSELMDAEFQFHFRSHVDSLICLEWNPDIESFSALVESAALTIHSYIIQINNRTFGDSRVRAPAKECYMRDIIRLRGGDHDYYVIGTIDIKSLRDYQRPLIPDQSDKAKFKPTPPGFKHSTDRLK